jgi:lipopolysaccharide transport system ATP-binding protein
MSLPAIRVKHLSKRYRIGAREDGARTFREALVDAAAAPVRRFRTKHQPTTEAETIWALNDVSFEVQPGEVLGIIGRNGAGKSTLLKILSRITQPTRGSAEIRGRVASLLEVGTGFHSELTGRENVFLNGAILGMSQCEIRRRFDEIVAFAEVEKFIDTPVKRYSSGMHLRLAFSVAAHLEPEVLLVDETLAVGDAAFQKKCLGKMGNVAEAGRTVLFVSHNLGALANLCPRALLLVGGAKEREGPSGEVIRQYIEMGRESSGERLWPDPLLAPGNEKVRLRAARVLCDGEVSSEVRIDAEIHVEMEFWNFREGLRAGTSIHLYDHMGVCVLASANMHSANLVRDEWFGEPHPAGLYKATCTIPANFLNSGTYSISAIVVSDTTHVEAMARDAISFNVTDTGSMRQEYHGRWIGVVRPKLAWQTEQLSSPYRSPEAQLV